MSKILKPGNSGTAPGDTSAQGTAIAEIRFKKLIENSHDGLRLLDKNLNFIYRSASAERILGWDENDRTIYKIDALVHPEDMNRVKTILNKVRAKPGLSQTVDFRSKHFDGHYIWLESTFTNHLKDPDIKAIVCNFRDITAKNLVQEQLQQTIKQLFAYRHAIDESAIVAVTDEKGIITHVNENFCRISGYDGTELVGQSHRLVNSGYHDKAFFRNLWQTIKTGKTWRGEIRNKTKDGGYYWVDATIVPFLNNKGKPFQYMALRYDITERKKAEEVLLSSERKYRELFENNPLPVFIWDVETFKIIDCNTAAENKYGYTKDEFLKLTTIELRAPASPDESEASAGESNLNGKIFARKRLHRKRNGDLIFVEITGQMMTYHGQKMALAMINDITQSHYYHELDRLEKEVLEKSAVKENILNEVLDRYLQGIEALHPGMICSLLENRGGFLYNLASPSLPGDYINVVHGSLIEDKSGPCAMAASLNKKIIIGDIQSAKLSDKYKESARRNSLMACWAHPIADGNHQVMAVFAWFYRNEKTPTALEQKTIARATNILQVILESYRREQDLKTSNARFETAMEATYDVIWDWDLNTDTVFYSDNFKKLFGHDAGLHEGNISFFSSLVHPDDLEKAILDPDKVKYGTMTHWTAEYRFKKASGEYALVRDRAVVSRDANGIGVRMVGATQDITKQKQEEQHLKLLESVATNTTDAVLIAEARSLDESGPRILYVNDAFTQMTGYAPDEIIGKTPGILQGPKSDPVELKRMAEAVTLGQAFEGTIINYRKNGEEYWKNFSVVPVNDANGLCTHMIAIERDVTAQKNEELRRGLLADISQIFNDNNELKDALDNVLERLAGFGDFCMAEAWLIGADKNQVNLTAKIATTKAMSAFYDDNSDFKSFPKKGPFAVPVSQMPPFAFWHYLDGTKLMRHDAAIKAGLKAAYIVPLKHNNELLGILVLGSDKDHKPNAALNSLFESFGVDFGAEVKRKQLEQELTQIFNFAPDIICIAGVDGYFKKVNPAMCALLEFTEDELLAKPYVEFVHPEDRTQTVAEVIDLFHGKPSISFENRYITKSGKIKVIAWTATNVSDDSLLFCVAKDVTEKKNLEKLLDKATVLARIGAWEIDLEKGSVHWSDMTREIHEAPVGFEPDIDAAVSFYPEGRNRETIVKTMEDAINIGTPGDEELQIVTAKGNLKWVRVIVETEFTNGKCTRVYGSFQDIDERKQAEIAGIQALEERNTILESIGDAFFAVDQNWKITYWNNMAEKVLKVPKNEMIGQNLWEIYSPLTDSESYQNFHHVVKSHRAVHFEFQNVNFKVWLEASVFPAENGLTVYVRDITDRKKAEASARESLEERNTILESIDDAFFAVDQDWTVTYWNNTAGEVLKVPRDKIINHNLWEVFSDSVGSESYKRYHEAVETNQAVHFEDYYPPIDKWYEISAYPANTGLSVYFKDVTERKISEMRLKDLNENLQKQTKELAISNAELEQFAYVASHDLQEPLRMVTSFLSQLEKKYSDVIDDKGRQYIHFAVDGAKRMRQIILDLLDFSRVGRMEEDPEEVDFNKLLNEIMALYRRQTEELGAKISFEKLPMIQTYKTPLRQVLQNLIGNSLKYHTKNGVPRISISCKETKTHFQFSVEDNGIGIASEYFEKIFIIFQRLHNKDEYSGTGMGLAIAKKIVENLGGKIWVKSTEGKGSTFCFTLLKK